MHKPREIIIPLKPLVVFMGTPDFSVPSLRSLVSEGYDIQAVVTQPDRPRGRGRKLMPSPVKQVAVEYGIEVFQSDRVSGQSFRARLARLRPDILFVVAFGQILKKELLDIPSWGALNIHASLLPKYRGAAPIHRAILNREDKTGLTAMRMDEGLDTGPIVLQEEISVPENETAGHLHDRLSKMSGDFAVQALRKMSAGGLHEIPQDHSMASYAPKIGREDSVVDWNRSSASLSALLRALDPWPGAVTTIKGREIKLFSPRVGNARERSSCHPGRVNNVNGGILEVETADGILGIMELQAPGRKRMGACDFLKGFRVEKGEILGG